MIRSLSDIERAMAAVAGFERPHIAKLRSICREIGYGRAIQLIEGWMEEKVPGYLAAADAVAARRHRRRSRP